jgi:D-alanyl-D-alanine dipeptidase
MTQARHALLSTVLLLVAADAQAEPLAQGLVYADQQLPDLRVELRYHGSDNFLGVPVDGYEGTRLILTAAATDALARVQDELRPMGLGLLVYDGYRPQRAVDHFVRWAQDLDDQVNKASYYPEVDKALLFEQGYIAARSGHSRGSTVDLTIAPLCVATTDCAPLDMGTPWDYFGPQSWPSYTGVTAQQRANRLLLRSLMMQHGFRPLDEEWWHFTLVDEPFAETYFDFPVE